MGTTSPYLKSVDAFELEARFSNENRIRYDEIRYSDVTFQELKPFLNMLPKREQDLVNFYHVCRKNQKDIAKIFGVTQGAISSRLSRAYKRLKFLRDMPKISEFEIDTKLGAYFDDIEIEIIKIMMKTTCQSKTAQIINDKYGLNNEKNRMTQVKVRHRFEKCIICLKQLMRSDPELKKFHDLLINIKANLYKLHEVKLPHFNRGNSVVFSMDTDNVS